VAAVTRNSLGQRSQFGKVDPGNPVFAGGWTVTFMPADHGIRVEFEVYHIAVRGPAGSNFEVWQDSTFYDSVSRGGINSWDPSQPMLCEPATTIYFYYSTAANPRPTVSIFCRERSPY
jgi:hypothetical protein